MTIVTVGLKVQVTGGPVIALNDTLEVEAYDKIDVAVDASSEIEVQIQPGGTGQVSLLLIRSSRYDATKLSFKASDGTADSGSVALDRPQLFSRGGVALFGVAPNSLKIKNDFPVAVPPQPVTVEILVGRDATA